MVIEVLDRIVSDERKSGDPFSFRLAQPVVVDGHDVIPAGTHGVGEVVHAAPAHGSGQAGELILAARYLEVGDRRVALRGMKLAGAGDDRSGMSAGVSIAIGVFAMFIHGGEMEVPVGAIARAKLAEAYVVPTSDVVAPSSAATSSSTAAPSTQE
ncbi:hypothetical protein [Cognatilysobacter terrigena]|uniref:hypothetical protein n=1 Tax=Cognatilysobacter terrigena TaxID=2488749 RepID=UPI00105E6268|nr:hypothetical protein [Lysobacter terrigena]